MDTLEYVDILRHKRRALLAKDKVSSIWLAIKDAIKLDYKRNYKRPKRKDRKERI